jgi:hypothetical protein
MESVRLDLIVSQIHDEGTCLADYRKGNSPYKPEDYNFVQHAIEQGYSVFFYDRLGQGSSDK